MAQETGLPPGTSAALADWARDRGCRLLVVFGSTAFVHLYDDIDYEIVAASIRPALDDFGRLAELYAQRL